MQALWRKCAGCLSGVPTYFAGTVGQGCRLSSKAQYQPPGHCGTRVQAVIAVSEPTSVALWGRGAGCLSIVGTYLSGTVGQWCRLFNL